MDLNGLAVQLLELLKRYPKYPGDSQLIRKNLQFRQLYQFNPDLPLDAIAKAIVLHGSVLPKCSVCGKPVRWYTPERCWSRTCSATCSRIQTNRDNLGVDHPGQSQAVQDKRAKSLAKRFGPDWTVKLAEHIRDCNQQNLGVNHPMQLAGVKEKLEQTMLERYGVVNPGQSEVLRARAQKTMLERYGVVNPGQSEVLRAKAQKTMLAGRPQAQIKRTATCLERYEVTHYSKTADFRKKYRLTSYNRYGTEHPTQADSVKAKLGIRQLPEEVLVKLRDPNFWVQQYELERKPVQIIAAELGTTCATGLRYFEQYSGLQLREYSHSYMEQELQSYLAKLGLECSQPTLGSLGSTVYSRQSLDCYIASLRLAFECNGLYWHSEDYRSPEYHLKKTLECERLGIRLVHIWSDDWAFKRELMERKIRNLVGLEPRRVSARKCRVMVPTVEELRSFYDANHIKGYGSGSVSYGLSYQEEIVAAITFRRTSQGWDLNRYATSCNVPGGFSRLLSHFRKEHSGLIYTFADRSWSRGDVYRKAGFELVEVQPPTFHGIEQGRRVNRMHYTVQRLQARFPELTGTAAEIMAKAGILRVWDCGQLRFELCK